MRALYDSEVSDFLSSDIGLEQGDPSSPLMFMFFVKDITQNINSDLDDVITIDDVKLFLILYADDMALFATSQKSLQSMLNDIENYCSTWGMKINVNKTKAMVFENGRSTFAYFYIYGQKIELVNSFKYLGVNFFKNGNWARTQKQIADHASFSLHNLFSIFRQIELPNSKKIHLFDVLVGSVLNFCSEIWGTHRATDIEMIHF